MLSEVFWVSTVSVISGVILKLATLAFKSKCTDISFCGINIKRNVELEIAEEPEIPKNNVV